MSEIDNSAPADAADIPGFSDSLDLPSADDLAVARLEDEINEDEVEIADDEKAIAAIEAGEDHGTDVSQVGGAGYVPPETSPEWAVEEVED